MKKQYDVPELFISLLEQTDVITTSVDVGYDATGDDIIWGETW